MKKPIDAHYKPTLNHKLFRIGQIAQSVEQRTENPCVPSSILGLATTLGGTIVDLKILLNFWVFA